MGRRAGKGCKMNKIVVTGGGGFVGKAVARMAQSKGAEVTVLGRSRYPDIEKAGIRCLQGDIRNLDFVTKACKGADTVMHVAAIAGIWGPWKEYYSINVLGTENVIRACKENSIPNLVYTSTPSVVFNRASIEGANESLPLSRYFPVQLCAEQSHGGKNDSCRQFDHTCYLRYPSAPDMGAG